MTLIMTFDIEDDLGPSLLFQKYILEVRIICKDSIILFLGILVEKSYFPVSDMLISYYANKKVPQGCRRGNQA